MGEKGNLAQAVGDPTEGYGHGASATASGLRQVSSDPTAGFGRPDTAPGGHAVTAAPSGSPDPRHVGRGVMGAAAAAFTEDDDNDPPQGPSPVS